MQLKTDIHNYIFMKDEYGRIENMMMLLISRAGYGKCFGKGTKIIMFDGNIKNVEDITYGDILMGEDSTPRVVKSTTKGFSNLYKIKQKKGNEYIVNEDHVLSLRVSTTDKTAGGKRDDIIDIPLLNYLKKPQRFQNNTKGFKVGIDFIHKNVPIDPYWLGLWLGDGDSNWATITNQDEEIIKYIKEYSESIGLRYNLKTSKNRCDNHAIVGKGCRNNFLLKNLENLNLRKNKHIPHIYKTNSREIRLNLLAGLIDSDGTLQKNGMNVLSISQKNKRLSEDIVFLARSLGFGVSIKKSKSRIKKINFKGEYYRIGIWGDTYLIPMKVKRKKCSKRRINKNPLNTGIFIEFIGKGDYYGFTFFGDNKRFLLDDFTVVHNTIGCEGIIEEFHRSGYVVICIADPKDECELAFAQFLPKEKYHLESLKKEGKKPETKKVKIYHPFTYSIPRTHIPNYNFYTFSLKDLGREEWSMIAETSWDTDTIKLLLNASQNVSKDTGLYGFVQYMGDLTNVGKKQNTRHDPRNFYLNTGSGTAKSIQEISNYLQPFKKHYFLSKDSCPLKLDIRKILQDNENYHVFVTNLIKKDKKIKEFTSLVILNQIIENKDYARKPILIVIPEIRYLTPFKPQGYKLFLANGIKNALSTIRSQGSGMSALLDSQVFHDIDENVSSSATLLLLGEIVSAKDTDRLSKIYSLNKDKKELLLTRNKRNSYFPIGAKNWSWESENSYRLWFPRHRHCEQEYNFFRTFEKENPEKLKNYSELIKTMAEDMKKEEEKIRDKIRKDEQREKEKIEFLKKEREEKKPKDDKSISKAKEITKKSKNELMRLVYEEKQRNPDKSIREIGRDFKLNHITVKKYLEKYPNLIKQENNV